MGTAVRLRFILVLAFLMPAHVLLFAVENACEFQPIKTDPKAPDIFTPEQEVYLGDILAEFGHQNSSVIDDAALTSYLNMIGNRLVKQLPPTNLNFCFYLSDEPYANAFRSPVDVSM